MLPRRGCSFDTPASSVIAKLDAEETDMLSEPDLDSAEEEDAMGLPSSSSAGAEPPLAPRGRRAVAQPSRLEDSRRVVCYLYQHTLLESSSWKGHAARLCFFLPENWSPSYRFTVFEDSYVVCLDHGGGSSLDDAAAMQTAARYHLARPLHSRRPTADGAEPLPEFEVSRARPPPPPHATPHPPHATPTHPRTHTQSRAPPPHPATPTAPLAPRAAACLAHGA